MQVKAFIGVEDLVSDGMAKAYRLRQKLYDPSQGKYITLLYHDMHRYFIRNYVEWYGAQQRGWEVKLVDAEVYDRRHKEVVIRKVKKLAPIPVFSIQGMQEQMKEGGHIDRIVGTIPSLVVDNDQMIQHMLATCCVIPGLIKVYQLSSDELKHEMVNWFWEKKSTIKTKNPKFQRLSSEFRTLCSMQYITCDDCIHITRSPDCLDSLSRQLFWIPYDTTCLPVVPNGKPLVN